MAAPAVAGGFAGAAVGSLADLGEESIRAVVEILRQPVTVEFGGYGKRFGGRWGGKRGQQGTAAYIRRVEMPLALVAAIAYLTGVWKPGGLIGAFFKRLFGQEPGGLLDQASAALLDVASGFIGNAEGDALWAWFLTGGRHPLLAAQAAKAATAQGAQGAGTGAAVGAAYGQKP